MPWDLKPGKRPTVLLGPALQGIGTTSASTVSSNPGYPDIDVKEGLSDMWISTFEADAIYHEQNEASSAQSSTDQHEPFEALAAILGTSYREAKDGEAVAMIHLFGIRYAEDIRHCGRSATKLMEHSSVPNSYVAEVHKGMRLAKFVTL